MWVKLARKQICKAGFSNRLKKETFSSSSVLPSLFLIFIVLIMEKIFGQAPISQKRIFGASDLGQINFEERKDKSNASRPK